MQNRLGGKVKQKERKSNECSATRGLVLGILSHSFSLPLSSLFFNPTCFVLLLGIVSLPRPVYPSTYPDSCGASDWLGLNGQSHVILPLSSFFVNPTRFFPSPFHSFSRCRFLPTEREKVKISQHCYTVFRFAISQICPALLFPLPTFPFHSFSLFRLFLFHCFSLLPFYSFFAFLSRQLSETDNKEQSVHHPSSPPPFSVRNKQCETSGEKEDLGAPSCCGPKMHNRQRHPKLKREN